MQDALEMLSDDQDLSQVVGAYLSDKSIDMWNGARQTTVLGNTPLLDPGRGNPIEVVVQVTEAFVGATATVLVELVMADDEALTSNLVSLSPAPGGSITVGIAVATLVAGYQFRIAALPVGVSKRYLGLRYNIFTATTTAGKCSAWLAAPGGRTTAAGTMA
mgnify:CR=1 FL=1